MNNSENTIKFFLFACMVLLFTGCFEEDNFFEDNIELTGRSFPVISDLEIINAKSSYAEGETVRLDVRFWSEDPIESIALSDSLIGIRAQQQFTVIPYSEAAFSETSQTDSLVIEYTVPTVPNDTTQINLEVEVTNENGLSLTNVEADNFAISPINITVIK